MLIEWIKSESDHFCSVNCNRTNQIRTLDRFNLTNVDWINQGSTKSNSPKLASVSCRNSDNNDNNNKDKSEGNVQKSASARVDASDAPKRRPFNGSDSFHSISFFFVCLFCDVISNHLALSSHVWLLIQLIRLIPPSTIRLETKSCRIS